MEPPHPPHQVQEHYCSFIRADSSVLQLFFCILMSIDIVEEAVPLLTVSSLPKLHRGFASDLEVHKKARHLVTNRLNMPKYTGNAL